MAKRYKQDEKAAADLATALKDLPDNWLACRDMRHSWAIMNDFHVFSRSTRGHIAEIARELYCTRCATVRKEIYHHGRYGLDKVRQSYSYPDHYQIKGVPRGVKPQSIVQNVQYERAMERIAMLASEEVS